MNIIIPHRAIPIFLIGVSFPGNSTRNGEATISQEYAPNMHAHATDRTTAPCGSGKSEHKGLCQSLAFCLPPWWSKNWISNFLTCTAISNYFPTFLGIARIVGSTNPLYVICPSDVACRVPILSYLFLSNFDTQILKDLEIIIPEFEKDSAHRALTGMVDPVLGLAKRAAEKSAAVQLRHLVASLDENSPQSKIISLLHLITFSDHFS